MSMTWFIFLIGVVVAAYFKLSAPRRQHQDDDPS